MTSSLNPSQQGQPVTFTATTAPAVASGTITFKDGSTILGTAALSGGVATFQTTALSPGSHPITAAYGGTISYAASTSAALSQNVTANGTITLRVTTSDGDGTFVFASVTPSLSQSLTTSGGIALGSATQLNAGLYTVTATVPSGFALTAVTCSDGDSSGSVSGASASINLAPAEAVTCTFSTANPRKRATETIARFLSRRNDLLMSNGPETDRQVDRLIEHARGDRAPAVNPPAVNLGTAAAAGQGSSSRLAGSIQRFEPDRMSGSLATTSTPPDSGRGGPEALLAGTAGNPNGSTSDPQDQRPRSFSASVSQMMKVGAAARARSEAAAHADGQALQGDKAANATTQPSAFDLWVDAKSGAFSDNRSNTSADGRFGIVYVGADYVVNNKLLVGTYVQFDSMRQTSEASAIKGRGWMAGPYATLRLSENVFLQGRAAWGQSTNTVSPYATYVDNFETERWLAAATLKGRWTLGACQLRPSATVSYIEDVSSAYTDSLGVLIPRVKSSLGQIKVGPELMYQHITKDGVVIEPHAGIEAIYNFGANDLLINDAVSGPSGVRGKVDAGIRLTSPAGLSVDLSAAYDGIGAGGYSATTGRIILRIPLD